MSFIERLDCLKKRACNFEGHLPVSAVVVGSVTKHDPMAQGLEN